MPAAILLPILYALADRFAGGGWPALDAKLPGRAAFWGAILCGAAGWLLSGPWGAAVALVWLIWRTPAWKLFGGSATPEGARQIAATFARHLLAAPLLAVVAYWTQRDILLAAAGGVAFAVAATSLACALASANRRAKDAGEPLGNANTYVELARGAAFGLMVGLVALA